MYLNDDDNTPVQALIVTRARHALRKPPVPEQPELRTGEAS
jgi:hypothetical protein